ncbi:MAG: glucose-6-phosphate isomerase [Thermodesulfobacteriota bacterium]
MADITVKGFAEEYRVALDLAVKTSVVKRIWAKDASLWKDSLEVKSLIENSLGWLSLPAFGAERASEIKEFALRAKGLGYKSAVVLGMGGSSLCALVFSKTFKTSPGYPELFVLDSTDPSAIARLEKSINLKETLFIVSSKSGGTIEPLSLFEYFYDSISKSGKAAGENFVSITDKGSYLEDLSKKLGFLNVFLNPKDIGGRYSALSYFGLVPAALKGMDIERLSVEAASMAKACATDVSTGKNPGLVLGLTIGVLASIGRDKLTFLLPEKLVPFGLWIEQLIAESIGKEGKGILPIVGEPITEAGTYSNDRVFVSLDYKGGSVNKDFLLRLRKAGHPVVSFEIQDEYCLGGEFFRWEFAAAVCGLTLGINPFDQPDVEDAKIRTRTILKEIEGKGAVKRSEAVFDGGRFKIFFGPETLKKTNGKASAFKRLLKEASYLGLLSYTDSDDEALNEAVTSFRKNLLLSYGRPVQLGYGPRYLHSTGQLHKGGPAGGVFMIMAAEERDNDMAAVGKPYSFGTLEFSQALGDAATLDSKGRVAAFFELKEVSPEAIKEVERWLCSD